MTREQIVLTVGFAIGFVYGWIGAVLLLAATFWRW